LGTELSNFTSHEEVMPGAARKSKPTTAVAKKRSKVVDFRTRTAQIKREKMRSRLLLATMEVCADGNRRGAAVIDDVVKAAGVSRGSFYLYFNTLDEAIEALGLLMADQIVVEAQEIFRQPHVLASSTPALNAALGGEIMMCRGLMDRVWAGYLSNVHLPLDESRFVLAVQRNLGRGRDAGQFQFDTLKVAADYQIGAVMAAIRRCSSEALARANLTEMNTLILRGLGLASPKARSMAVRATEIVNQVGPQRLPWWRDVD
jgi:AcrR family transcriptional regulator